MGFYDSRLNWLLEHKNQTEVSVMTGIPQSTISYVSRGLRDLPEQYKPSLRNAYQREVYATLNSIVPNKVNSNRWRGYAPNTVNDVIKGMNDMIELYSYGAVSSIFKVLGREPTSDEIMTALPAARQSVIDGLANSPKSYEDWSDYPDKRSRN